MARSLRIQYPGAYYHVTCRGNDRKEIFLDDHDQKVFLEKLSLSLEIYNVSLMAYVCMFNHFHLLLTTPEGNLSEFMRHFNISYTSAFNRRHKRVGHLYQGRYKAYLIQADNYLLAVSRYIHLNPIRGQAFVEKSMKGKWNALLEFKWSSLPGYLLMSKSEDFVNYGPVLAHTGGEDTRGREAYRQFIKNGIEQETMTPLEVGKGHGIVGEKEFVEWVKEHFLEGGSNNREQPALRKLGKTFEPNELIRHFLKLTGKEKDEICERGRSSLERAMLMEFLYRFCQVSQPEIGTLAGGIDYSAVSRERKKLQATLKRERKYQKIFNELEDRLIEISRVKI